MAIGTQFGPAIRHPARSTFRVAVGSVRAGAAWDRAGRLAVAYRRMALPAYALAAGVFAFVRDKTHAYDSYVYWSHSGSAAPYAESVIAGENAFLYSPAFSQAMAPAHALPFDAFLIAWTLVLAAALWFVAREWAPVALLFPPVVFDIQAGNVTLLLALAVVAGLRWPSAWAFVLLSKPSAGVGLLWFAARGEWHKLAVALVTTATVAAISFAVAPELWWQWGGLLVGGIGTVPIESFVSVPLPLRVGIAAAIVVLGARRDWPWTIAIAACIAMPVFRFDSLAVLVAVIALWRMRFSQARPTPTAGLAARSGGWKALASFPKAAAKD